MKEQIFNIPLTNPAGTYRFDELEQAEGEILTMNLSEYGVLSYTLEEFDSDLRFYSMESENFIDTLQLTYDDKGDLFKVETIDNNINKCIYLNMIDEVQAKAIITQCSHEEANAISKQLLQHKEIISRLFVEHFYDGEAFDFAAKYGTVEDKQNIQNKYGQNIDYIDNYGDYPLENRIESNTDKLGLLINSCDPEIQDDMYHYMIDTMTEIIKNKTIDKLNKSDDFKFIPCEYD